MTGRRLRFGFYGAIFLPIVDALRKHTEHDVDLLIDSGSSVRETILKDLRSLEAPDWLKVGPFLSRKSLSRPWAAHLTKMLDEYDVLVVAEHGALFAQFTDRPYYFLPIGGDLTLLPFPLFSRVSRRSLKEWATALWIGIWQRRGIRRALEIWTAPWPPFLEALERLSIPPTHLCDDLLPIGIESPLFDVQAIEPEVARTRTPLCGRSHELTILHPSRLMMNTHPALVASGQWKRNEVVFQGFAQFRSEHPEVDAVLVVIDQAFSPDREAAKRLCGTLGIQDSVEWLSPDRGASAFSWSQMADLYAQADVVMDDFGRGWFGNVVVEGLLSGCIVISYVDEAVMARLYDWHPIQNANGPSGVAAALEAALNEEHRQELKEAGPRWIREFHGSEAIGRLYGKKLDELTRQYRPSETSGTSSREIREPKATSGD